MSKKVLVAYFTHGGSTKKVAATLARLAGADLAEIKPIKPYPEDEEKLTARTKEELAEIEKGARPTITVEPAVDVAAYDAVLVGSPNWWGAVAAPVTTFLADHDFAGKTVSVFCSEAGDTMSKIDHAVEELCADADVRHGLSVFNGATSENQAKAWLENIEVL